MRITQNSNVQAEQKGQIGINVYSFWCSPYSNSSEDVEATQRVLDFTIGWILNPLVFGDYPDIMKKIAGQRLPSFTESQALHLKGSFDFIGWNHYTSVYVRDNSNGPIEAIRDINADMLAIVTASPNDTSTGPYIPSSIRSDPPGLRKMLMHLKEAYGNPPIYIEENGYGMGVENILNDTARIDYLTGYIGSTLDAIRDGSNVRGYFVWSFLDVFEFLWGYQSRCGLYYVDLEDAGLKRQPKLSAHWYSNFLKEKTNEINIQKPGLQETSHVFQ